MIVRTNLGGERWQESEKMIRARLGQINSASLSYRTGSPCTLFSLINNHSSESEALVYDIRSPDFSLYVSMNREEAGEHFSGGLHQHDFYELMYVAEGTVYQNIENERHLYPRGSLCLLNKNTRHTEERSTDYRVAFLQMSEPFLRDVFHSLDLRIFEIERSQPRTKLYTFLDENLNGHTGGKEYMDFIPLQSPDNENDESRRVFNEIAAEFSNPRIGSSFQLQALCCRLMLLLRDCSLYDTKPVVIGSENENLLFARIIELMTAECGRITRAQLEEQLHYSGAYLNRIVKKYTGSTIFEYGSTISMKQAADWLRSTDMDIAEIATRLHFGNRTNFYRQFEKIYHITPAKYRSASRNK